LRSVLPDGEGERVEFSGCEAGTRLVYINWEGNVYPCDSIPILLGNLLETSFEQIWCSAARQRIVEAIHSVPIDCDSCVAHSGCRGLAHFASGNFDAKAAADVQEDPGSLPKAH